MKLAQTADNILALRREFRHDIEGFARHVCNFYEPCEWQRELARSVIKNQFTVVTSGQGTGKSSWTSVIILWWLLMSSDRIVLLTGSSESGLKRTMRRPLLAVLRNSIVSEWFEGNTEELRLIGSDNKCNFILWSENAMERTQGVHLPPGYCKDGGILVWNDEASSLPQTIHESFLLSMDNDNCRMVMTGNPLRSKGPFYNATESSLWNWIQVNAEYVPYTNKKSHSQIAETYGKNSTVYRVRVLGLFPESEEDRWFNNLNTRFASADSVPEAALAVAGIDVGEQGSDPSAVVIRSAGIIRKIQMFHESDHVKLKTIIGTILHSHNVKYVAVDANGPGYGFAKMLAYDTRFTVFDVKGSMKAAQNRMYENSRTEMYGNLREFAEGLKMLSGIPVELRQSLREELKAQQVYLTNKNLFALVKKDLIKSELGGRSPDIADALSYSYCNQILHRTGEIAKVRKIAVLDSEVSEDAKITDKIIKERMDLYMTSPNYRSGVYHGW